MSVTAKSVILDIADNWGNTGFVGLRSVDFWNGGSKITITEANGDFVAYATTENTYEGRYWVKFVFDTSLSKTGDQSYATWLSLYNNITNQRLVCVFDSELTFDEIRINNYHTFGTNTNRGAKNVIINISTDTITDTTYNASISNSTEIFNGQFDEHTSSDVEDEQVVYEPPPSTTLVLTPFNLGVNGSVDVPAAPLPPFKFGIGIDMASTFLGRYVTLEPFNLGLFTDFSDVVQSIPISPFDMDLGLENNGAVLQSMPAKPFWIGLSIGMDGISSFETGAAIIRYLCILTGAADGTIDLILPMSSFQARRRSGDPTYLSVVVPTVDYAAQIAARPNGTLKIQQAYEQNGIIKQIETIIETTLVEVNPDEGGSNQSTTLTGYSTSTYSAKSVTLSGVTYRATRSGKYHYRLARPYIFLNPGDTVTFSDDGVSFVIDVMNYFINPITSTIELAST